MRAIIHTKYGPPEVAKLAEVDKPSPGKNDVLIKVFVATVNRTDCGFRSAEYFVSRFFSGLFYPKNQILGNEFAGLIEATGSDVSQFKVGDRVFGYNDTTFGAHAEYMIMNESAAIAIIPDGISYEEAAPICEGGHYALIDIKAAKVNAGQHVLVNGATGAIGSAAVQLLKCFGAHVTAVCNTRNVDLIRSLGADVVLDYEREDFTKIDSTFDFVFDAVGKSSFAKCKDLLKPKGVYISTELGKHSANVFLALSTPLMGGKKVLFPLPSIKKDDVLFLRGLVETGKFRPLIDRSYRLEDLVDAYRYVERGQKTGNVIIKIF